jgi:hypothetical protein
MILPYLKLNHRPKPLAQKQHRELLPAILDVEAHRYDAMKARPAQDPSGDGTKADRPSKLEAEIHHFVLSDVAGTAP